MPDTRNQKLSRLRHYIIFLQTQDDTEQNRKLIQDASNEILVVLDEDF